MEQEIWRYLQGLYPGQVQVLGTDVMNSGPNGSNLYQFNLNVGGLTFPLLRDCADGFISADTNLIKPYIQRDNYVVINKVGIIRYHAAINWNYGERYHADELRGTVDSLVIHNLDVGDARSRAWSLAVSPNPAHGTMVMMLANPGPHSELARVSVFDPAGRRVAELPLVRAQAGITTFEWDGRGASGERLKPGLYLVHAEVTGAHDIVRRVVIAR